MQSSSQIMTTNKLTPSILQAGCHSRRPTSIIKALMGKCFVMSLENVSDVIKTFQDQDLNFKTKTKTLKFFQDQDQA